MQTPEAVAKQVEEISGPLLEAFAKALESKGIKNVKVTSFELALVDPNKNISIMEVRCPMECKTGPDGKVRCKPLC